MERPVSLRYLPFADPWALMCCWAGKGYNRPECDIPERSANGDYAATPVIRNDWANGRDV